MTTFQQWHPENERPEKTIISFSVYCYFRRCCRHFTFPLAIGANIAKMKTPTSGPVVADDVNIALSMTPDKKPTQYAIPITITA